MNGAIITVGRPHSMLFYPDLAWPAGPAVHRSRAARRLPPAADGRQPPSSTCMGQWPKRPFGPCAPMCPLAKYNITNTYRNGQNIKFGRPSTKTSCIWTTRVTGPAQPSQVSPAGCGFAEPTHIFWLCNSCTKAEQGTVAGRPKTIGYIYIYIHIYIYIYTGKPPRGSRTQCFNGYFCSYNVRNRT